MAKQFDYDGDDTHDASAEELVTETATEAAVAAPADGGADPAEQPGPSDETAAQGAGAEEPAAADASAAVQDQRAENGCAATSTGQCLREVQELPSRPLW